MASIDGAADYQDAVDALYARMPTRMGPSLERITRLTELLDHPERTAPAVHLTGTNGKTFDCLDGRVLLAAFGVGAGVYTSPHLQDAASGWRCRHLAHLHRGVRRDLGLPGAVPGRGRPGRRPASDLLRGADRPGLRLVRRAAQVDAQVVEVGMGGTWDATNPVHGNVAIINQVALDHPEPGDTLAAVATEKAGIIKAAPPWSRWSRTTTCSPSSPSARPPRRPPAGRRARLRGRWRRQVVGGQLLDLRTPGGTFTDVLVPLHGRHQVDNAAGALASRVEAFPGPTRARGGRGPDAPASERRHLDPDVVRAGSRP